MSSEPFSELAPVWNGPATMHDGACIVVRPLRADDAAREQQFIESLSDDARYMRFFRRFTSVPHELLAKLMDIDYDRSMALAAVIRSEDGEQFLGVARYGATDREDVAEFAVAVLDSWQKRGIASVLVSALMSFARDHGFKTFTGDVLPENEPMLQFARGLHFDVSYDAGADLMHLSRELAA